MNTKIQGAILKLNDTITDEDKTVRRALREAGKNVLGLQSSEQENFSATVLDSLFLKSKDYTRFKDLTNHIGRGTREMLLFGKTVPEQLAQTLPAFRQDVWKDALTKLSIDESKAPELQEAACEARWRPGTAVLVPGAHDLLTSLKDRSVPSCVVTNGLGLWQREIVDHALGKSATHVVVSGDAGHKSSSPEIISAALRKLGIQDPKNAIFVGNQDKDISAANKAGIERAYWVNSHLGSGKRDLTFSSNETETLSYHKVAGLSDITSIVQGVSPEPRFDRGSANIVQIPVAASSSTQATRACHQLSQMTEAAR